MNQFSMACTNRINTESAPDHIVVGFKPVDQVTAGNFQLVLPVADFDSFKPGRVYTFTVEEAQAPAVTEE